MIGIGESHLLGGNRLELEDPAMLRCFGEIAPAQRKHDGLKLAHVSRER